MSGQETKYTVRVPDSGLEDVKKRLALARFPDELDEAGWDYGAPLSEVKRLTKYWAEKYDWRKTERELNSYSNYHTSIEVDGFDAIDLHYIHQKSSSPDAIPLIFVHGWPGSHLEVLKILPKLVDSSAPVSFHVVAPSLPNFAWSSGIRKRGFGLAQYAETCQKLMQKLGYASYATQGGDWGFYITRALGLLYPSSVLASHINMVRAVGAPAWTSHPLLALAHATTPLTQFEKDGAQRSKWFATQGHGYREIQATKPQTPGYGVADSPVALLAWLLEKLHDWTDEYPWTEDEILTWVSVYWFSTAGPAASFRIYYESTHSPPEGSSGKQLAQITRDRVQQYIAGVRLGLSFAPKELTIQPRTWGRTLGDVVYESQQERGGHFLAHEKPDAVVKDLRGMFGPGGPCADVVAALKR